MPTLRELRKWRTTRQAAKEMGVSRQRVSVLLNEGRLRGVRIGSEAPIPSQGIWAVDPESIAEFLREREERAR